MGYPACRTLLHVDDRCIATEGVDDGHDADLATIEELVMHEVHRPDCTGFGCCRAILAQLRRLGDLFQSCRPISL